jgi:UDP-N-acetylglucosamine:LPS N-acetylglucosamine transferase
MPKGNESMEPEHAVIPFGGPRHVLLIASTGGHLGQLLALRPWWEQRGRTWITFDTATSRSQLQGEDVIWAYFPTTRNLANLIRNMGLAAKTVPQLSPDLVVSTGAGVAVPFFLVARAAGIPTVYIEVFDRLDTRTLTGRMCRPISDLFLVQWEEQLHLYPGSTLIGALM